MPRHYTDYFTVPVDYKANMTREAINETPETWLDFYPHVKYVDFFKTLISQDVADGGNKSLWLTGNYGTGKSNAALVTQKLFMDDESRVRRWFVECKDKIDDADNLLKQLLKLRNDGTLVVYDYDASGVGPNDDFLVRLERSIVAALQDEGMIIPAKANMENIIARIRREDKHFFEVRDSMQKELAYLSKNIKSTEQLITELQKPYDPEAPHGDLLGDVQRVFHRDNIYLDVSVPTFRKWITEIASTNNLKRIIYIFDEFSDFVDTNSGHLKYFEDVTENPGIGKFYLIPVTHLNIDAFWSAASQSAAKAKDRFYFRNLQMPNDTAFKLAAHAMKPVPDLDIADEWKSEKQNLWESVKGITELNFEDVSKKSFFDILPIHPMAAFLLKFLSESARSNQRSIFEYLKGSADGREFQDFIHAGGPAIPSKQFLTVDYLWKYFIEREDLGLNKEIVAIRDEFNRIIIRDFQNKDEDDDEIRVLKTVLLFCLLSRLSPDGHECLKPTVQNIELSFQGDGSLVGIKGIVKALAEKHCFSVVDGNIELFSSSVANADLDKRKAEFQNKFHELLSEKIENAIKTFKKNDIGKFSEGRFDLRVSDVSHTTMSNITSATREKYSNGLNKDTGAVCLWFVVAKNKQEQLEIPGKIAGTSKSEGILKQLRDHRIMIFTFPKIAFCDTNAQLWDEYVEQYAKYMLENDNAAKEQCKTQFERLEKEWFRRLTSIESQIQVYTYADDQVIVSDCKWNRFKDIVGDYVRKTLPNCVDYITDQLTAFDTKALKSWAIAGIAFDNNTGESKHKQLVTAFKNQGITADTNWFEQNANHPVAQIRSLFDKKISNTIGKGSPLSIRKVYIELQRSPFGFKYNALSAFVLGVALRHILDKGYQWDNLQKTGSLDTDVLAQIIEDVIKDDGTDKIKGEKYICRLSREEKAFVEKAPLMFGITPIADARVEDALLQIQNRIQKVSNRVPLWILPEYIRFTPEPKADDITTILNNLCLAGSTSSKSGKKVVSTTLCKLPITVL